MSNTKSPVPLREMAAIVFSLKKTLLSALLIPPALAIVLILVMPPIYRADTELLVKTGREYLPQTETDGSPAGPTSTKQEAINSELELLISRGMAEEVISAIGLKNLYPGLIDDPPWFSTVTDAAIKKLQKSISAEPVKLSNVIDVTYDDDDPVRASKILDTFIGIYLGRHSRVYASGKQRGYEEVIGGDMAALQRLEHEKSEIKLAGHIYDIGPQRAALIQQRVDAQTHLQDATDRKATLDQRIAALESIQATVPPTVSTSETDHSFQMDHASDALTDLRQSQAAVASRYSPENPELIRIRAQIAALEGRSKGFNNDKKVIVQPNQLSQQVQQELVMDQVELAPLTGEITRYRKLIDDHGHELDRLESSDTALRLKQQQIDAIQTDLLALRPRFDQARTEDELDRARMTSIVQIAPALTPDKQAWPKPLLFLAAGQILGLLAFGGVVVLAVMTRKTFYTEIGLERHLRLPVLASLDWIPKPRGRRMVSAE